MHVSVLEMACTLALKGVSCKSNLICYMQLEGRHSVMITDDTSHMTGT